MINLPSLQNRFTWIWSRDPALNRPPAESDAETRQNWAERFDIARDTGKWSELVKDGEQLTLFTVKPLSGTLLRRLTDEHSAKRVGDQTVWQIVARLCLIGIDNPPIKIERELGPYGDWAKEDVIETLEQISPAIVSELGSYIFARASSPPGK